MNVSSWTEIDQAAQKNLTADYTLLKNKKRVNVQVNLKHSTNPMTLAKSVVPLFRRPDQS